MLHFICFCGTQMFIGTVNNIIKIMQENGNLEYVARKENVR